MNHCKLIVTALALIGVLHTGNARAEIKTEVVEYNQADTALEGFLAYDDAVQGKRSAILVAHTWTGVSDFIRTRSTSSPACTRERSSGRLPVYLPISWRVSTGGFGRTPLP